MSASNDKAGKAADPRPDNGPAADADKTATPPAPGAAQRDDEDEWRHEPIPPVDERNPLKSLGRAVADVATGGSEAASTKKPDR